MSSAALPASSSQPTNGAVTLRLLEIFSAVAQEKSMSAAAGRLGVSQGAVSLAIANLEQALSVVLFDRSVRPPALTLAGKWMLDHALDILQKVGELEHAARYRTARTLPSLTLGLQNSFITATGPHLLDQLRALAKNWYVKSGFNSTRIQSLVQRETDVIVTSDQSPVPAEVVSLPLYNEPFFLVVPARYTGPTRPLRRVAENLDFIHYGQSAHMEPLLTAYFQRARVNPVRRYHFDTPDAALQMVAANFGWVIVTPLIYLRSRARATSVRVEALPPPVMHRKLIVAARRSDGADIAERVRRAAVESLTTVVLPQVQHSLSEVAKDIWIASVSADERI